MQIQEELTDRCNICGRIAKLTEDHVPPKFWNNNKVKYYSMGYGINDPEKAQKAFPWQARNGIVFHSICEKCNNDLLGEKSDKSLKEFIDLIKSGISKRASSPFHNCNIYVNRVARAVIGHILASKEYYDNEITTDKHLRAFLLNPEALPPEDMHLYFFFYPYDYIVIARDVAAIRHDKTNSPFVAPCGLLSCLYSYPIAFILAHDGKNSYVKLKDLFSYCTKDVDDRKVVLFEYATELYPGTNYLRDFAWPINVSDKIDGASSVVGGESIKKLIIAKGFR